MADGGEAVPAGAAPAAQGDGKATAGGAGGDDWAEKLRGMCEPEQHWRYRREFLLRNREALAGKEGEGGAELRRLASFSMVWANHVFLGCRYPPQVMEKVMDMAAGIVVTNAPAHILRDELVAKVKRGISSSNEGAGEPSKKRAVGTDKPSPVSSSGAKSTKTEVSMEKHKEPIKNPEKEAAKILEKSKSSDVAQNVASAVASTMVQKVASVASPSVAQKGAAAASPSVASPTGAPKAEPVASPSVAQKVASVPSPSVAQKVAPVASPSVAQKVTPVASLSVTQKVTSVASSTGVRTEAGNANESTTTNRHQAPVASSVPGSGSKMNYCSNRPLESNSEKVLPSEKKVISDDTAVLVSKSGSHTSVIPAKVPCKLTSEDAKERQPFFNRLYKAVAWKLVAVGGFGPNVNHVELLNSSIQSVKATLDVDFVPLKELADLPQNKSSQENVVCELRCKSVYLGTGCGKSKENAKAVASREALKLFLKKKVIVKLCKRKYKGKEIEDLVLLDEESKPLNLPPALRNPQEIL